MILVSQGFLFDPSCDEMKQTVRASLRANAPVFFVDTRGLVSMPEAFTAQWGRPTDNQDVVAVLADVTRDGEGSEAVALDTGGFVVKNSNDLTAGMTRIAAESRVYYLLGYSPSETRRDGSFRSIEVRLREGHARGLKLRTRRGYYAPKGEATPRGRSDGSKSDPLIGRALDSPLEIGEIGLRAASYVFDEALRDQLSLALAVELDLSRLTLEEEKGRYRGQLAFLIEAQHRETGEYYRVDERIALELLPETKKRLEREWHLVVRHLTLPPGGYQAKIVVRDLAGTRVGSLLHDFEVRKAEGFRLTTPILTDAVERGAGGRLVPVVRATRVFAAGTTLYCQFGALGAARDRDTGGVRVSSAYEIRRTTDGVVVRPSEASQIQPTSLGSLLRLIGINLSATGPGNYELVLRVWDEVGGERVEIREPFELEAAPAAKRFVEDLER
jgi:hypothetical protein